MRTVARLKICLALLLIGGSASVVFGQTQNELTWRKNKTADATIQNWPLPKVLARLSSLSGWKILVEPGLDLPVNARFKGATQRDALKLLLGDLNYALVPEGKGGSRLYVYKNSLGDATALIKPEVASKARNWLANEIILTVGPDSKEDIEKLAAELGGKVVAQSDGLNAYRIQFEDAEAAQAAREKLASRPDVEMQDNYGFDRPAVSSTAGASPSSLFPIDPKPVTRGDQITVALVDTPIQPMDGKMKDFILPSVHIKGEPATLPSDPTHATSMAQTLLNSMALTREAGKADSSLGTVRVLPIDIYGNSGTTTTFEVAQGLYQAIQSGSQVINLSLGGEGDSAMVDYLIEMARKKEILVFASAGNSPTTEPTWPAANPNAIAVTAADWNGNIASYANRGAFVDVKAPGNAKIIHNGQTFISSGTSTATAFISGQAAGLAARRYTSVEIAEMILKSFDVNAAPVERVPRRAPSN